MRRLRVFEHISLDGVIEVRGSGEDNDCSCGDWTAPYRSLAGRDALRSPMTERLNAATKYVATHRTESLARGPFESLEPFIVEEVRRIKASGGPDRGLPSGVIVNSYQAAGPLQNHQ
jgi:hypothetical protein